jgi:tripartite-type tricarboxylate transporter receptor subunit TctC
MFRKINSDSESSIVRALRGFSLALVASSMGLTTNAAQAADAYPSKPIRLVHGYGAGSSMDTNSRTIAQKLSEYLGQSITVEARPGATGTIAAELVAKSAPDGYTLLASPSSSLAATPHLRKVPFNTLKDFSPVATIGVFSYLLAAHVGVPAKTVKELIALAKTQPGKLTYGSNGSGSAYHLAGELLELMAGIDMVHVPYKGGGTSAATDLITGRIDMMWNNPVFLLPQVQAGKLRAIAVTGEKRIPALPDVPTIGETVAGYEMSGWQGIVAPAATPKEVIAKLASSIQKALASPDVKTQWNQRGMEALASTPEEFGRRLRADYERYGKLVEKLGKVE